MSEPACERCIGDWAFELALLFVLVVFAIVLSAISQELKLLRQWKDDATKQLKDHERQNEMQWRSILNLEGGEFKAKEVDDASE